MKIITRIKSALLNKDGTLNGTVIASLISFLIVLIQEILRIFGIHFTGDIADIVAGINTIPTNLGLLGIIENNATVNVPPNDNTK